MPILVSLILAHVAAERFLPFNPSLILAQCSLLRLAHPGTVLGGELLARHLGTCRGGELLALVPFSTSASKICRQVLDSDITDTDLKAAAATCVFGDVITPFRVVTE